LIERVVIKHVSGLRLSYHIHFAGSEMVLRSRERCFINMV
jgi:hypothetical protein